MSASASGPQLKVAGHRGLGSATRSLVQDVRGFGVEESGVVTAKMGLISIVCLQGPDLSKAALFTKNVAKTGSQPQGYSPYSV